MIGVDGGSNWSATLSAAVFVAALANNYSLNITARTGDNTINHQITASVIVGALTISVTPSSPTVAAGGAQQFTANVSGTGYTYVTWSRSPALGTINNAGLYTAPASVPSNTTVTVTATSMSDSTKLGTAMLTVTPFTPTLGISSSAALPDAALNSAYSQSLVATGGTPPYSWTVQPSPPSTLPAGLTLSSGGVLSGTPAAAGSYSFTLAVADSGSPRQSASQLFSATIGTTPDMGQMAVLELFVLRHTWLTDPSASGANANGGLYGLPDDDLSFVNTQVATAAQQLAQVQSQAATYTDGFAYLNAKNAALQSLNTQLQSPALSAASRQKLSDYMANALSRTSSQSLDSNAQALATVAPKTCNTAATNCEYMWSEINFFNGGGSYHGLGSRLDSFVEGVNARDFTSQVKNFVLKYCLPNTALVPTWTHGPTGRRRTAAPPPRGPLRTHNGEPTS